MKKKVLTFLLALMFGFTGQAQTTRFFEFSTTCGHGNWQDTTFIASTSDQVVIDSVLANLSRPLSQRHFINGPIDYGNGGHNHNATHWFLWHFVPDQWSLVEQAIELCDGCPFTDVDADTAYWVGTIGQFCPWSGRPVREVSTPVSVNNDPLFEKEIILFPNPAKDEVHLKGNGLSKVTVTIYNATGHELKTTNPYEQNNAVDVSRLESGLYFVKIRDGDETMVKKLIVDKK